MVECLYWERTRALAKLFEKYDGPPFCIRLWDGWNWHSPGERTIIVNSVRALLALVDRPSDVTLGEAFVTKDIDVDGDLFSVFDVAEYVFHCPKARRQRILEAIGGGFFGIGEWWKTGRRHSKKRDSNAISYHYDQPVAFYEAWLGKTMAYSCAYFRSTDDTIDQAQTNKLELICQKLRVLPCERLLDIGCGWGSLILHAASRHNVEAHGITIVAAAQSKRRRLRSQSR